MLTAAFKFARPRIVITCAAVLLLGAASGSGRLTWATLPALLALVLSVVHANSINDYTDLEIDRVNLSGARDRPLVTGDITIAGFWALHLASALALLVVCLFLGLQAALAAIVLLAVNYMYSLKPVRLTDRPVLSPLILALAYVYFPFSLGWWSSGSNTAFPWLLSLGLFWGFVARMLLKDFRDRLGDQRHSKTTFLLRYGSSATVGVSAAAWILATITLGLATGSPAITAALAVGTGMVILWLRRLAAVRTRAAQEDIIKAIAIAGNWAIISVVVFYLCRALGFDSMSMQLLPAVLALGAFAVDFLHHYIEAGYAKTAH